MAIGYQNGAHAGSLTIDAIDPRGTVAGEPGKHPQRFRTTPRI
ncbi:MAG: hypothetical protein P4M04_12800 [Acidobacteriota bacterium]|nr:hypothetical protein [Acidobacteriota bacterium]